LLRVFLKSVCKKPSPLLFVVPLPFSLKEALFFNLGVGTDNFEFNFFTPLSISSPALKSA
jgi:hypothetical protein